MTHTHTHTHTQRGKQDVDFGSNQPSAKSAKSLKKMLHDVPAFIHTGTGTKSYVGQRKLRKPTMFCHWPLPFRCAGSNLGEAGVLPERLHVPRLEQGAKLRNWEVPCEDVIQLGSFLRLERYFWRCTFLIARTERKLLKPVLKHLGIQ